MKSNILNSLLLILNLNKNLLISFSKYKPKFEIIVSKYHMWFRIFRWDVKNLNELKKEKRKKGCNDEIIIISYSEKWKLSFPFHLTLDLDDK